MRRSQRISFQTPRQSFSHWAPSHHLWQKVKQFQKGFLSPGFWMKVPSDGEQDIPKCRFPHFLGIFFVEPFRPGERTTFFREIIWNRLFQFPIDEIMNLKEPPGQGKPTIWSIAKLCRRWRQKRGRIKTTDEILVWCPTVFAGQDVPQEHKEFYHITSLPGIHNFGIAGRKSMKENPTRASPFRSLHGLSCL